MRWLWCGILVRALTTWTPAAADATYTNSTDNTSLTKTTTCTPTLITTPTDAANTTTGTTWTQTTLMANDTQTTGTTTKTTTSTKSSAPTLAVLNSTTTTSRTANAAANVQIRVYTVNLTALQEGDEAAEGGLITVVEMLLAEGVRFEVALKHTNTTIYRQLDGPVVVEVRFKLLVGATQALQEAVAVLDFILEGRLLELPDIAEVKDTGDVVTVSTADLTVVLKLAPTSAAVPPTLLTSRAVLIICVLAAVLVLLAAELCRLLVLHRRRFPGGALCGTTAANAWGSPTAAWAVGVVAGASSATGAGDPACAASAAAAAAGVGDLSPTVMHL